jgi:ribonucleoside-diphosphate reductase alpha chain
MAIAMTLFVDYPKKVRLQYIFKAYDFFSKFKISLPTPILSGARTPLKRYASCCLIDVDDTLDSLAASNTAVLKYTASRSGIGLNMGRVRSINSQVRNGEVVHTGIIPFLKWFESCVKSCQQNGIRGGGATVNFPFWHMEIEDIMTLKNNSKTGDNSVRHMDYCIGFSRIFYERFLESAKTETPVMITLFSPHNVKDLYDAWGDNDKFDELYVKYENDPSIPKKQIPVDELMKLFTKERRETARIYAMNVDHCNDHGSFN